MVEAESTEPQRRPDNNVDTNATHPRKEIGQDGAGQKKTAGAIMTENFPRLVSKSTNGSVLI